MDENIVGFEHIGCVFRWEGELAELFGMPASGPGEESEEFVGVGILAMEAIPSLDGCGNHREKQKEHFVHLLSVDMGQGVAVEEGRDGFQATVAEFACHLDGTVCRQERCQIGHHIGEGGGGQRQPLRGEIVGILGEALVSQIEHFLDHASALRVPDIVKRRPDVLEQSAGMEEAEDGCGMAGEEDFDQFVEEACLGSEEDVGKVFAKRAFGVGFQDEIVDAREFESAKHADGVFAESDGGVSNAAHDFCLQVGNTACHIQYVAFACHVAIEGIDGEITAFDIVFQGAELVVLPNHGGIVVSVPVVLLGRGLAEGADLEDFAFGVDVGEAESPSNQAAAPSSKHISNLFGGGGSCDVVVLGRMAEQKVPNGTSYHKRLKAMADELPDDFNGGWLEETWGKDVCGVGQS